MQILVVDSSVVIKWFVPEVQSAEARRILDGYLTGALRLIAPDLLDAEVGNIVWKKHLAQGMAIADAEETLELFQSLAIERISNAALLRDAWSIAVRHHRTVYDSLYVALAQRERCSFVSADDKLVRAIGPHFPNVISLADWRGAGPPAS
jgi:predicted nucleic acid-binding protein